MRFAVFAIASVPDTASARALLDLQDLDDKAVSKVLFHRRKQQTGSSEILRWDQRAIAGMTLIQHALDRPLIDSLDLSTHAEPAMLDTWYKAVLRDGCMVSWSGDADLLALLRFRSLRHRVSYPAYWQAIEGGQADVHLDLCDWLSPSGDDRPGLDDTARKLGLPGLLGAGEGEVYDAWLAGRHGDLRTYSDLVALNSYLLAVRVFSITGRISRQDGQRAEKALRSVLETRTEDHIRRFLDAWSAT